MRERRLLRLLAPGLLLGAIGCGVETPTTNGGSRTSGGNSTFPPASTDDSGAENGPLFDDAGAFNPAAIDGGLASDCATGAGTFIFVISDANDLYTFDPTMFPSAQAFTRVGNVSCNASGVNSMAVDRSATAWVNFNDGTISKVTTTAPVTCTPTSFVAGQGGFTKALGMGFSVDAPGSNSETLFVSDNAGPGGACTATSPKASCSGKGLGRLDLATMTLTPLGPYTDMASGYNAELTGTGDGRLFGFFTTTPGAYGPIDKTTGETSAPPPSPISSVNAANGGYAFSFWGGDFYFYTAPSKGSIVTHLVTATGATSVSPALAFTIVGAGVSTCAPTVPPTPK